MGEPGTGKTIFAEQLLFHNAGGDRPLLYITTLSEPLSKVVTYVQRFSFFDVDRIGQDIQYEDLGRALSEHGPEALLTWLADAIKTRSPRIIVIDSFRAIHDLAMAADDMRAFMSRFAGLLSAYDVTAFLLGEYTRADVGRLPEFAVADSIVELARQPLTHARRAILSRAQAARQRVSRGTARFSHHERRAGAVSASRRAARSRALRVARRAPSDRRRRTRRAHGRRAVRRLDHARRGRDRLGEDDDGPAVRARGRETRRRGDVSSTFRRTRRSSGAPSRSSDTTPPCAEAQGFSLMYASPVELQIDSIVARIFETIQRRHGPSSGHRRRGRPGDRRERPQRLHDYLYSLIQHFAVRGVTTMLTLESGAGACGVTSWTDERFSYMSDNLIHLAWGDAQGGRRGRFAS